MSSLIIDELGGSGKLNAGIDGMSGTRIARCLWLNWPATVMDLMGVPVFYAGYLQIIGRQTWPGLPLLQVNSIDVEGMGKMHGSNWYQGPSYEFAKLTINYKVNENEDDKDENGNPSPYLIESLDYGVDIAVVPVVVVDEADKVKLEQSSKDAWKNQPLSNPDGSPRLPVPIAPANKTPRKKTLKRHIRIPTITYKVTIPRYPNLPNEAIQDCLGRVNDKTIFGGVPGTVLFDGPNAERESIFFQQRFWRITYQFMYQPFGWNHQLHPETLQWVPAKGLGSDRDPYENARLQNLFPAPYRVRG